MAEEKMIRLGQASRKLNVGHNTILDFLAKKGFAVENNPNTKLSPEQFAMLSKEYASSASEKIEASGLTIGTKHVENQSIQNELATHRKKTDDDDSIMIKNLGSKEIKAKEEVKPAEKVEREKPKLEGIKVVGKIDLDSEKKKETKEVKDKVKEVKKEKEEIKEAKESKEVKEIKEEPKKVETPPVVVEKVAPPEQELIKAKADKLQGLKVLDRIDLPTEKKSTPQQDNNKQDDRKKRPRKRIPSANDNKSTPRTSGGGSGTPSTSGGANPRRAPLHAPKGEPSEKEIQDQIRATLAK
ncbi:hypothetical protein BH10BAC4_BH10BAC4_06590 [soil metagenome]